MANYRKWFFDWSNKWLVVSDRRPELIKLPEFIQYETIGLEVYIIEPDPDVEGSYVRVDITNMSLTVTLSSTLDTATPEVQTTSWTKDLAEMCFRGELALNTAALNAWIAANSQTAYLEVETQEGTQRNKVFTSQVTVERGVTQPTTTAPVPVTEYLTVRQGDARYAKFYNEAGATITFVSPDGNSERTIGVRDGGVQQDDITGS